MTSREIAELTGKNHSHVCRDVRAMLNELHLCESSFGSTYTVPGPNGGMRAATAYALPKDLTITLVSGACKQAGYSVVMRHRIVTR